MLGWLSCGAAAQSTDENFMLPAYHFQSALRRERMRTDRSGTGFSLLAVTLGQRAAQGAALANVLEQRIRGTDTAGWLAKRKVGIILPDTPALGAWKLAGDLRLPLEKINLSAQFEVYEYPSCDSPQQQPLKEPADADLGISAPALRVQALEMLFVQKLPTVKRLMDIAGAASALAIASPLILAVALAIKVTSRGPILYAQQREGSGGRTFWIYKFRTMVVNADAMKGELRAMSEQDGPAFKLKNDPRVVPIGRLLRRTCLDELPQLFNVLQGSMSLVGPRPLPCEESRRCERWERRRLDVTPGLTCTWQVHGGTKVTFREWMRMDLRYVRSRSLWKDLQLMALTLPSVIKRDGVY
jgi:lipopolysaccharide/colanic/teichoic acid biosynthesis glycosyltransferase